MGQNKVQPLCMAEQNHLSNFGIMGNFSEIFFKFGPVLQDEIMFIIFLI